MEPEVSLRHSQQFATSSYHEPDQSSSYPSYLFLKTPCNILPSTFRSSSGLLSSGLPTKTLLSLQYMPYALPSSFLICAAHYLVYEKIPVLAGDFHVC